MRLRSGLLAICLLLPSTAFAQQGFERTAAGFVFIAPKGAKALLLESPAPDAKVIANPPVGARLVYRSYMEVDGKPAWYKLAPPGQTAGWIAAADVSVTRPTPLPVSKPMRLTDDTGHVITSSGGATAAARGLDGRAKAYAASRKELEQAVIQFATLEKSVETQFSGPAYDDHQHADGTYVETEDNPIRKQKAADFRRGIK